MTEPPNDSAAEAPKDTPMKNKLADLNNHLFAQLERLGDEELTSEQIADEVKRTDAIVAISDQIVGNANMVLKAVNIVATHGDRFKGQLAMISGPSA